MRTPPRATCRLARTALFSETPVDGDSPTTASIEHETAAESILLLNTTTTTGDPLKLRGPLSADGKFRPSVEKGFRYGKDEWWRSFLSLPRSYILYRIRKHLSINTLLAVVVTFCYTRFQILSIPMLGHTLSASFLSLLLVFRQSSAYERFYEARALWSDATACCRMLALDTVTNLRPFAPVASQKLLTLVAAFPDALTYCCLSGRYPLGHNVKKLVIPRFPKNKVLEPATLLLYMMQETLKEANLEFRDKEPLDNFFLYEILEKVHRLTDIVTKCEKIVKTPVPWSYSRHLSRFLTIWSATLASALVSTLRWLTVPTVALVCWAVLGIESIGHVLENPYLGKTQTDIGGRFSNCFLPVVLDLSKSAASKLCPLFAHSSSFCTAGYTRSRRARMTQPYDIGIPVFVLSNQARLEVEGIASLPAFKTE